MTFRRSHTHLFALGGMAAVAGTLGLARIAQAGQGAQGDTIYRGDPKAISGITARAWGSGTVAEDTQVHLSGTQSIRITTHGLYQGASLVFATPINLNNYLANKDAYLQFAVNVKSSTATGAGGMGGLMGASGGASMGSMMGMGRPPGMGGRGSGAMGQMSGGSAGGAPGGRGAATAQKAHDIQNLRVQMITTGGQNSEFLLPLEYGSTQQETWKMLTIPIAATGLKPGSAEVKEIRVFGDAPGVMNLGQIRTLVDSTPISVDRIADQTIARGSTVTFRARATAGAVPLKFSWDFDASDGIQEEKVGRAAQFRYRKSGDFITTVTVTDVYGHREPKTIKFKVFVP